MTIDDSNRRVLALENDKRKLEAKLVDKHAKPPQAMHQESLTQGGLDTVQQLKDEIYHMQTVNQALMKTLNVDIKAEMSKIVQEKEKAEDDCKKLKDRLAQHRLEIQRMTGQGAADVVSRREQAEEARQKRIDELEKDLEQTEERAKTLQD